MAASRLMNENTSLFSHADLQIQLHSPATAVPQVATVAALHESSPEYRIRQPKKSISLPRKPKAAAA